jgi:hypothetical protein
VRLCVVAVIALFILMNFGLARAAEFYEQDTGSFALGVKVGTLGAGLEGTARINSSINARLGVNVFEYDYSGTEDDIKYDFDLELLSVSTLFDWHPFGNIFRFTIGGLYNQNSLDMTANPAGSYSIGDTTYTPGEVGTLTGELDFEDFCPYIGIGWGNAVDKNKQWSFSFDLGVIYQGEPSVNLSATGTLSGNAAFQANLAREQQNLEDELEDFQFYPVVSFGISYSF